MVTLSRGDGWRKRRHLREDVRFAQRLVQSVSFLPCGADGAFGPAFESTVYAFQRGRGLYEDGVVGPEVWTELSESLVAFWDGKLEPSVMYVLAGQDPQTALPWCRALDEAFEAAGISEPLSMAHFCGQVMLESGTLKYMEEIWGPSAQQKRYDPSSGSSLSRRLGNTEPGHGYMYRGRGPFMLTGKGHYESLSEFTGKDFVSNPDLVAEPKWGMQAASWYWLKGSPIGDLGKWSREDDAIGVSAGVNYPRAARERHLKHRVNHLEERIQWTERAKIVFLD